MAKKSSSNIVSLYQPEKRFIIPIDKFHIPKKLFKLFKKNQYIYKIDHDFENVISQCQLVKRNHDGSWINNIIINSYINLFYNKMCHSVECYKDKKLVGGLYGVHIGSCFFGESMFSTETNTSKFCLLYLMAILKKNLFSILDSQFYNKHLIQFGAYEINNKDYLGKLNKGIINERKFNFIQDFHEVLSLLHPNNHKS